MPDIDNAHFGLMTVMYTCDNDRDDIEETNHYDWEYIEGNYRYDGEYISETYRYDREDIAEADLCFQQEQDAVYVHDALLVILLVHEYQAK